MKNILIVGLALFLFAGCSLKTGTKLSTSSQNIEAKRFNTKTGYSNVYIYSSIYGILAIDNQIIGYIEPSGFFKLELKPGSYTIEAPTITLKNDVKTISKVKLNALKDTNHFISLSTQGFPVYMTLEVVSDITGKNAVNEHKLLQHRKIKTTQKNGL